MIRIEQLCSLAADTQASVLLLIAMLRVKRNFFLQGHFEYFRLTAYFPSVLTSHSASNSRVSEISKIVVTFFMTSEAQWTPDKNILFFSKRSIVIKFSVKKIMKLLYDVISETMEKC